ncbi:hypothetical protein QE152_g17909 [Popillia japonica]|uniref:Uncharacterized protein n=1 Tax=Popillia japonica TaxID=7064 RepID=A0AAW1L672_POPJA
MPKKIINEISERDKRKCNIVTYGHKETVSSSNKDQLIDEQNLKPIRLGTDGIARVAYVRTPSQDGLIPCAFSKLCPLISAVLGKSS